MAAPTTAPAPVNTNDFAKPGESILDYETRLGGTQGGAGTGFGIPQGIPAKLVPPSEGGTGPAVPGSPPATPPASPGGAAPDNSGNSQLDALAKSLGYDSYADAVTKLTAPSDDTTSFYNSAYSAAGLDALNSQITGKQNDLNTATGNINDNPWLDEASRVGRVKTLTDMGTADIKNLQNEYNNKLKGVQDLVNQHAKDMSATDASNKAKLAFLEDQAKSIAATTKQATAAPKTIKGSDGATYQYDPSSGQFTQILPGKSASATGGAKTPVAPASPTGTGSQFANFNFTAGQLGTLNAKGLNQSDANGILKDIKNGQTLDNIRQQMRAAGLDPGLLDTIMFYVDPAHNTPAKK